MIEQPTRLEVRRAPLEGAVSNIKRALRVLEESGVMPDAEATIKHNLEAALTLLERELKR